jgi:hypothetical protein
MRSSFPTLLSVLLGLLVGRWTVTKMVMTNHRTGSRTEVSLNDVAYDVGLDDDVFTERALQVPPRKWLK